ncbi:MAG TPA: NADPH:quinone oxidoreductase family protein [Terriglobales bacterium]|nr:NADPH:quinone oxidoreductase family protein [Terriglobales bacterium]
MIPRWAGPEALELQQVPDSQPGPKEVLVRVEAAGVNFADVLTASGGYPGLPKPPLIAGREFAGVREDTDQRVMGYTQWGAFAQKVAARPELLWPIPEGWSVAEAAAFPVNYFTAHFAYWKAELIQPPERHLARVLIHAVAGGVGTAAVEIGKLLGIEMYGTSSSEEKLSKAKELGLQHAINYQEHDYEQAIHELTRGEGVDAVFEMLGGEHVQKSVRCLRDFGRVITYGSATGQPAQLDPRVLYLKGTSVHGLWLAQLSKNRRLMGEAWERLEAWANAGKLRPIVGHTLPIERASEAYRLLLDRKNFGKVVLTIQ